MDKIRKFFEWIWGSKERMVLAVMVVLLCWQVYKVVHPTVESPDPPIPRIRTELPDDPEELKDMALPEPPPPPPERTADTDYGSLYRNNPFHAIKGQQDTKSATEDKPNISLKKIMTWADGSVKAQLKTKSATKWYAEGEEFESFRLMSIDMTAKTCEIYSEEHRKRFTLTME